MSVKLFVTRNGIGHRGKTVNKGDVIEEGDRNHIGALQSVGCQIFDETKHGHLVKKADPTPEPEPEVEEKPEEAEKPAPKKRGRPKKKAAAKAE